MESIENSVCEEPDEVGDEELPSMPPADANKMIEEVVWNATSKLLEEDEVQSEMREALAPPRAVNKPNISSFEDAVVEVEGFGTVFLPQPGEGLIIQYPSVWRDTMYFTVNQINDETGAVWLWNPQRKQWAITNYKEAKTHGLIMKLAPEGASELRMALALGQKKRGRPCKNVFEKVIKQEKDPSVVSRGRGRPKGAKNRPKEVIEAERKAKNEERAQRAVAKSRRRVIRGIRY